MGEPIKKIQLKNGDVRYRFVVDIGADPTTGRRRQLTRTYDSKKEARAEYSRIRHETDDGTLVAPAKITVSDWLDTWLKSATIDVEKGTAANYADALLPVRERLGDRQLQQLDEEHIDGLVSWMLTSGRKRGGKVGTGLGVRSVELTLGRLRSALNVAVRRKLVVRNVAQYTKIPREARRRAAAAKAKRIPWNADEVKTFVAATRADRLHVLMLLSLLGMRPAEVCGLRWAADVDLEAKTIRVENTRTIVEGEVEEKGPKSEKGKRTLPLPGPVVTALKALKARQADEKLAAGSAYVASGYVLVDEQGMPWKTDKLRRETYKLMATAKVRKVRPYDARHACLTYLATSGVPDVIVSAWAGHADLSFTKRVYIHPNVEHLQDAADQLDALLG
ncbi:tyrosine recombinase XerC [Amycolatopsis sp. GM8]|uniref:site-specific integrase n=1 Tax=Amycolatopsis sp. GM8 TaxID=2896530 RepID=UPI001F3B5FE9|nr:tyrosine-type recombinase/integrase [Amycolatopsis sp. GM8]